jgi:hypothetical protein
VELKNGDTYNGHLVGVDNFMNVSLRDVVCTSKEGDKFWSMPEVYIRGTSIKYMRLPDEVADNVPEDAQIVAFCERLESERNAARAQRDEHIARNNDSLLALHLTTAERDEARADVARLRDVLEGMLIAEMEVRQWRCNRVLFLSGTKVLLPPHMKTNDKPTCSEIRNVWKLWG